jgi:hypothetical protein
MNRKIPIVIGIVIVIVGIIVVGAKSYLGDSTTELPGEEKMEKSLNLQESGQSGKPVESGESEAGEAGESKKNYP